MPDRKTSLRIALKLMAIAGICSVMYVFFAGLFDWRDSESTYVLIDISDLKPGEVKQFSVSTGKLLVLKRTEQMIRRLLDSKEDEYAFAAEQNLANEMQSVFRSKQESLFIAYGIDPFYRCDIEYTGISFKSVCVNAEYNLAGRAYKGDFAQGNLIVPAYSLQADGKVKLMLE